MNRPNLSSTQVSKVGLPSADLYDAAKEIVRFLLTDETPALLHEATVHRPKRGRVWVATFAGSDGRQVWRSTGLTNKHQALLVARRWEARARQERMGRPTRKPIVPIGGGGQGLSQREIALFLKISERAVRQIERRAVEKIKRDRQLYQLWQAYLAGELEEAKMELTAVEIEALFGLARTPEEQLVIRKVLRLVHA